MKKSTAITIIVILVAAAVTLGVLYLTNNDSKTKEIAARDSEIAEKVSQIERLTADISHKEEQIGALTADAADKAKQIEMLTVDVADKAGQIDTLTVDVSDKAEQIKTLTTNVSDKTEQIGMLTADVADKADQIETLKVDVNDKAGQIETLKADVTDKAEQIKTLKADVADKAEQIETLKADVADKAGQIEATGKELAEQKIQVGTLSAYIEVKTEEYDNMAAEVEAKAGQIKTLQDEAEANNVKIGELQAEVSAREETIEKLQAEVAAGQAKITDLQAEIEKKEEQIKALHPAEKESETEPAAESAAEETGAETGTISPTLLVTVNGRKIDTDDADLVYILSYYQYYLQNSGYDLNDESIVRWINGYSLLYAIQTELVRQKAAELGLDQYTEEERAEMEAAARTRWEEIVQAKMTETGRITEGATDEDKAAVRADVEADLLQNGYDEARYVSEYLDSQMQSKLSERLQEHLMLGKNVTDDEIAAYFDSKVQKDREAYEHNIMDYEYYTQYGNQTSYYVPEGYRGITHILLKVDDALLIKWKDLKDRLEKQQSADGSAAETTEPVTEEMVREAEEAILQSVKPTVNEIMARLDEGVSFNDLIREYGQDVGMQNEKNLAEGYAVNKDSIIWDKIFQAAAMALEKPGDVGKPVVSSYGVHILCYVRDIPAGPIELTEEIREEIRRTLMEEMRTNVLNSALEQWMLEADVVYSEAGEQWKLPENDGQTEGETTEATAEKKQEAEKQDDTTDRSGEPDAMSEYAYVTTDAVNFRTEPNISSRRIRLMKKYACLSVLDTVETDGETWYKVIYGDREGYVLARYVKRMTNSEAEAFLASPEYSEGIRNNPGQ